MLKKIKKFFSKSHIINHRGSVMSVALVVITVLSFSITTITHVSVNLAGSTTVQLEKVNNENTAKGLINQAIGEFEVGSDKKNTEKIPAYTFVDIKTSCYYLTTDLNCS